MLAGYMVPLASCSCVAWNMVRLSVAVLAAVLAAVKHQNRTPMCSQKAAAHSNIRDYSYKCIPEVRLVHKIILPHAGDATLVDILRKVLASFEALSKTLYKCLGSKI